MTPVTSVAILAGGTGGAKLAAGMHTLLDADLAVIANTADDCEVHGLHVSPDPDLCTYWLAGLIDEERGWGIEGDAFTVHEQLTELGAPGLVQPLGPRPRDLPLPHSLHGRGRHAHRRRRHRSRAGSAFLAESCRCARSRCAPPC